MGLRRHSGQVSPAPPGSAAEHTLQRENEHQDSSKRHTDPPPGATTPADGLTVPAQVREGQKGEEQQSDPHLELYPARGLNEGEPRDRDDQECRAHSVRAGQVPRVCGRSGQIRVDAFVHLEMLVAGMDTDCHCLATQSQGRGAGAQACRCAKSGTAAHPLQPNVRPLGVRDQSTLLQPVRSTPMLSPKP